MPSFELMANILLIVAGYLLGSISSAVLVCRVAGLPDPRGQGSGNPGATNVLRIGGKLPAAITLAGDFLKGFLPTLAAVLAGVGPAVIGCVMVSAFLGHLYPIFFKFVGGKGVATSFGVLFGAAPLLGAAASLTWLAVAAVTRISSLASLTCAVLVPAYAWFFTRHWPLVVATLALAILQFWRHRGNIDKLLAGEEARIGEKPQVNAPGPGR